MRLVVPAVEQNSRAGALVKFMATGGMIFGGIEIINMMRKQQAKYACNWQPSLAEQFHLLAA